MAENKPNNETVEVPLKTLTDMQTQLAALEKARADDQARMAGLEQLAESAQAAGTETPKLRGKKTFEPEFRTVRLRQYPVAGKYEDQDFVVGWSNRGAYQEVDRSGVSPQVVDYLDVVFLRNRDSKPLVVEKIRLLDLMNKGTQVHCKILDKKTTPNKVPTGEEIDISVFDPQHGLVSTGEKIDGYVVSTETEFQVQLPNGQAIWLDETYVN